MAFKFFNKCIKNYEFINSIEGSVASNYLIIMASVKIKIWEKKVSKRFLKMELTFIQIFSTGTIAIIYYFLIDFFKNLFIKKRPQVFN